MSVQRDEERPPGKPLHGNRLEEVGDPDLLRLLRSAAGRQEDRAAEMSATMFEALRSEIASYAAITDPALREDVQAVSASVVRTWLRAVRIGRIDDGQLSAIRDGARRRARQGIDLQSLLKAYRVAIRVMWRELVSTAEWQAGGARLTAALAEWALDFSDAMSTEVASAYLDEQERLARETERRRSGLLELVLAGRVHASDLAAMPELTRPHAIVVAEAAADLPLEALDVVGACLAKQMHCPLWSVRHRRVVAVLPRPAGEGRQVAVAALDELLRGQVARVGVGADADEPACTPVSYREAVEALTVGPALDPDRLVHDFGCLGLYAAALHDASLARRWTETVLSSLRGLQPTRWALPTLEAYLLEQGNIRRAAARLGLHANTMKYRVGRLRERAGRGFEDREAAAEILVALRLRRVLNECEPGGADGTRQRSGHPSLTP